MYLRCVLCAVAFASFTATTAGAQEKTFEKWTVGVMTGNEGLFAATSNDSGGIFGEYCSRDNETCMWLLSADTTCNEGNEYPVLVNTDAGASFTRIVCMKPINGRPRYAFASYADIERIVEGASWMGVAFPLASGKFHVSRFSLTGRAQAVAFMENLVRSAARPAAQTTRDEVY
jgi:hypothetical protein